MGKSNTLENAILDHVLGGPDYVRPPTVYVALFTADPTDAGTGAEVSTGDWTNYARVAVTNNDTNWPAAAGGAKSNGTEISFGAATIVTPVDVTHLGIWDAATAGNLLYHGALDTPKTITDGDTPRFGVGEIDITED